jgi:hypothetical protein
VAVVTIPCAAANSARWTQRTSVAGREYELAFDWNERRGRWSLSLADQDGSPIATGVTLVTSYPLLRGVIDPRRPPGDLFIVDTTGLNDLEPGFADLGTRFVLAYFDPGELAALAAETAP